LTDRHDGQGMTPGPRRKALLIKEKEFTLLRDERVAATRPAGKRPTRLRSTADGEADAGRFSTAKPASSSTTSCSSRSGTRGALTARFADNSTRVVHLNARDVTMIAVSGAARHSRPTGSGWAGAMGLLARERIQLRLRRVVHPEQQETEGVTTTPSGSAHARQGRAQRLLQGRRRESFHTYSAYARGIDIVNTVTTTSTSFPRLGEEGRPPSTGALSRPRRASCDHRVPVTRARRDPVGSLFDAFGAGKISPDSESRPPPRMRRWLQRACPCSRPCSS
jgi:hypothetical protein